MLRFKVITIFPEFFESPLSEGIIARAIAESHFAVETYDLREYSPDKHRKLDDYPYGGGEGMVLLVEPLAAAIRHVREGGAGERVVLLTPQGTPFRQKKAVEFAQLDRLILVCGRYEGFDERVRGLVDEELSLGDYVLNGGEVAALAVIETVMRLLPGVLGRELTFESHATGLLEYPQYTRPRNWEERRVPEVLLSGDHGKIREWRYRASLARTFFRRPDLLNYNELSQADREFLGRLGAGLEPEFEFMRQTTYEEREHEYHRQN